MYSFKYKEDFPDELERVFDEWANPLFLNEFFEENETDIKISIEDAIEKVKKEADFLRNKLLEFAESEPNRLNELFKNLNNNVYTSEDLTHQKARNRWLRLYAIKIDNEHYVITGGAIKLDNQHLMQDRPHTNDELIKINKARDYLKDQGVYDADSFQEIFF
ncbi:hypothetical protein [Salegentibacter maritimus]|uniref:Uncharacterized protein n=1 Tax=Salegentibacter maritimus TaxID=2794347 RepID=A0ABS0TEN4_9FLAO|nr:hypothetical protein [Salegentibacter maritimus]MBI6119495.1 hypothetical protein [Salegentibacter maritimus]